MKKAYEQGILLAGVSAGSICWFEEGVTDSYGDRLEALKCLGFLEGSNCPHYDGEKDRRPSYQSFVDSRKIAPGFAADDGVALHYIDKEIHKIISSRPTAKAYKVSYENRVKEIELETIYLGNL